MQSVVFHVWPLSLNIKSSSFAVFSFVNVPHFVYLFSWESFGLFPVWDCYEEHCCELLRIRICVDLSYRSFTWKPRSASSGSLGRFMFNCLRNCRRGFQSSCTAFHSHIHRWGFQFLHVFQHVLWKSLFHYSHCFIVGSLHCSISLKL